VGEPHGRYCVQKQNCSPHGLQEAEREWGMEVCPSDLCLPRPTSYSFHHSQLCHQYGIRSSTHEIFKGHSTSKLQKVSIWKKKKQGKLSHFTCKVNVNIEKSNVPQQNLLELIHKFNKLAGYEMNTQKLIACFYINNKQEKKKPRN
jgi:hypothetical protein